MKNEFVTMLKAKQFEEILKKNRFFLGGFKKSSNFAATQ